MCPPLRYYGSKSKLAAKLLPLLPAHDTYIEVFGGSGALLFRKPKCRLEVYNDLDRMLVNFFAVVRDRPDALLDLLLATPYARAEYEHCRDVPEPPGADEVERARRTFVRLCGAFSASPGTGWSRCVRGPRNSAQSFAAIMSRIRSAAERLRNVQIESLHFRDVLRDYDHRGALFFIDPPYLPTTRASAAKDYAHEMTVSDHEELLFRIRTMTGHVVLCGYANELYDVALSGWRRIEFPVVTSSADGRRSRRAPRVEIVWSNYSLGSATAKAA